MMSSLFETTQLSHPSFQLTPDAIAGISQAHPTPQYDAYGSLIFNKPYMRAQPTLLGLLTAYLYIVWDLVIAASEIFILLLCSIS